MKHALDVNVQSLSGSVLSEIYFWKPQNAMVSALFQLIISYMLGNAVSICSLLHCVSIDREYTKMHYAMPSTGIWRRLNPGPFNIKEHTCITIMASTASVTANAIGIVATLDLFYGVTLNPGAAIFQTFASQVLSAACKL
jgi:hypothetical protein